MNTLDSLRHSGNTVVVLGIHGLLNKPDAKTLKEWWKQAIDEGFRRNSIASPEYVFDLSYWADGRNSLPIALTELDEPYVPAAENTPILEYKEGPLKSARSFVQKWGGRVLYKEKELFGLGTNVEHLIGIKLEDLDEYYKNREVRLAMRDRLSSLLRLHEGAAIVLVAHSMGSIIAYDVLCELGRNSDVHIKHFITIGSPLGLPIVSEKIRQEFGDKKTPEVVSRWTNLADPGDKVALDCELADEFDPNDSGIAVDDVQVANGYISPLGIANNHKSYGYLRSPECTALLVESLKQE